VPRTVQPGVTVPFSNDLFDGALLFKVTPNPLPPPSKKNPSASSAPLSPGQSYYYWELQVQGKFKQEVDSWYMGLELSEPVKLGLMSRAIAMTLMKFVKSFEPDTHATAGDKDLREAAHMVTRHFRGIDYLVITPDGEEPPKLGADLSDRPMIPKLQRPTRTRTDVTYTFSTFSTFVDLMGWRVARMPGGYTVDLSSFFGKADIAIVAYTCDRDGPHLVSKKQYFLKLSITSPNNYTGELDAPVTEAEGPPLVASARTKSGLKEGSSLGAALKKRRSRHHSSRFLPVALGGQSSPSSSRRANSREAVKTAAPSPQQQVPQVKPVAPLFSQIACPSPVASSAVDNNLLMWMSGARPNTRAHAKPHSGQRAQGGHRRWRRWLVGGRDCPGAALASPTGGGSHRALESPRSPMQLVGVSPRSPVTGLSEAALVAQAVREAAREAAAEAAAIKENHEANKVSIRRLSSRESKSERRRKHGERGEAQEADVSERNVSGRDSFPRGSRAEHSIMVAVQQESGESTSGTATACVAAKPVRSLQVELDQADSSRTDDGRLLAPRPPSISVE